MLHQEFEPQEVLRDVIRCFWYDRKEFGAQPTAFDVLPDGYAELIFHFGSLYGPAGGEGLQPLPSPFLVGLLDHPARFYAQGAREILGVRCFPWTVFDLLGLPAGRDRVRILEHPVAQLQPLLAERVQAGRVDDAVALLRQYFGDARKAVAADSLLAKAGAAMQQAAGTLPVRGVAAAAHATVRTLERKFKRGAGHTVKDVSGIMRFEGVRNRLWLQPDATLAGLAAELGYTDQAHLSRDFKRYSGTTPAAFARAARTGQAAVHTDFVAFVQA